MRKGIAAFRCGNLYGEIGKGVYSIIENQFVAIGNRRYMRQLFAAAAMSLSSVSVI